MSDFDWNLRQVMASREIFQTTDLGRMLAEHGVKLSREQVYRLVTSPPQRLNMSVLVALCELLDCEPGDLIQVRPTTAVGTAPRRRVVNGSPAASLPSLPVAARIQIPEQLGDGD